MRAVNYAVEYVVVGLKLRDGHPSKELPLDTTAVKRKSNAPAIVRVADHDDSNSALTNAYHSLLWAVRKAGRHLHIIVNLPNPNPELLKIWLNLSTITLHVEGTHVVDTAKDPAVVVPVAGSLHW